MENTIKVVIEEIALEGPHGIKWDILIDRVKARACSDLIEPFENINFENIRTSLSSEGIIAKGRADHWILQDARDRYQVLGVSALPVIYESPQSLRLLELIARGRDRGAWSFNLCSAMNVDAKQLFHLTGILVEYGLVTRKSNIPIPRQFKSAASSSASTATFFIHYRFSTSSKDPDILDIMDPAHSTDSVVSLIHTLLREAGGVMTAAALRRTVVVTGTFAPKQYRRGRDQLLNSGRIEAVHLVANSTKTEDEGDDDDDDDNDEEEEEKEHPGGYVQAYRLVDRPPTPQSSMASPRPDITSLVKEETTTPPTTPELSDAELFEKADGNKLPLIRHILRSRFSFRNAVVTIIRASGEDGITSREISRLTGISAKGVSKILELIRAPDSGEPIDGIWKNEGRKKFLVYKYGTTTGMTIKIDDNDDEQIGISPPQSTSSAATAGRGYVTAATLRRATYVSEILREKTAISLIDLGRAIEAVEVDSGLGIPGVTIDRRTLRKICDIANFPVIEKSDPLGISGPHTASNTTKLMIVYDPNQISATEAADRVHRPIGLTPKSETLPLGNISDTMAALIPATSSPIIVTTKLSEINNKSRLAAIAVFGDSIIGSTTSGIKVSPQIAMTYGYVVSDIFKARRMHAFLIKKPGNIQLMEIIENFDLIMYLQILGCGIASPDIDAAFNGQDALLLSCKIREIPLLIRNHLKSSVMGGYTETSHLSRILLPLVKLGLLRLTKIGNEVYYEVQSSGRVEAITGIGPGIDFEFDHLDDRSVDPYWDTLHKYCSDWAGNSSGSPLPPGIYRLVPNLMKMSHWKSKVILSLGQRRALEGFLHRLGDNPTIVDGSNEDLIRVCIDSRIEISVALRALRSLYRGGGNVVFAQVLQARYLCDQCRKIFYQHSSVENHYRSVHASELPSDLSVYTRPEYIEAIEKVTRKTSGGERSRRRRRRRERRAAVQQAKEEEGYEGFTENHSIHEKETAFSLAMKLCHSSDSSFEQISHPIWKICAEILGYNIGQMDRLSMKDRLCLVKRSSVCSAAAAAAIPAANAACNMLILNKSISGDMLGIKKILGSSMASITDQLARMHAAGLLAYDRSTSNIGGRGYVPSRILKIRLFGKHAEIFKFLQYLYMSVFQPSDGTFVTVEESLSRMENAKYLDNIDGLSFSLAGHAPSENDDDEEDDEEDDEITSVGTAAANTDLDGAGIRKHLELSSAIGGAIEGVNVCFDAAAAATTGNCLLKYFFQFFTQSSQSWRPTNASMSDTLFPGICANESVRFEEDEKNFQSVDLDKVKKVLAAGEDGYFPALDREIIDFLETTQLAFRHGDGLCIEDRNRGVEISGFMHLLATLDPRWYYWYILSDEALVNKVRAAVGAGPVRGIRVGSFTSADGLLNEQVIADLMIHVLYIIHAIPGVHTKDIAERFGVIPQHEIDLILSTLNKAKFISNDDSEWFIVSPNNW